MPGKIFVNYRRDDARDMAARIRDRLAATFGDANLFMDVDNLLAGQRFDKELEKALGQTDVFLAVIGPRWLDLLAERQANGERDYVRKEIAGALQRGIVVIPVLIERTALPRHDTLPKDIRDLVLHQSHEVTHARFGRDVEDLVETIRFARKAGGGRAALRWAAAAILALLVLGGGFLAYQMGAPDRGAEAKRQEEQVKAAEKARQEEIKRLADAAAAKKKAAEEAQAKGAAEEAERRRLAVLNAVEARRLAERQYVLGRSRALGGNYAGAIVDFTKAIEINPRHAAAYRARSEAYLAKGDYDGAIADYTKIIEMDPQETFNYLYRGRAFHRKGDYNRAIADYTKIVEISPRFTGAHYDRGRAYEAQGRSAEAISDYRRALEIDASFPGASEALKRLGASQ